MALIHVLFALAETLSAGQLVVAHVNHQFRGAESDAEANFVGKLADVLGLPCEIGVIDVPAYIEETSLNGQAAAREKRYEFLHRDRGRNTALSELPSLIMPMIKQKQS